MELIKIGLIQTDPSDNLTRAVAETSMGSVAATVNGYCADSRSAEALTLVAAKPEIILIGVASDTDQLLQTVKTVRSLLPESACFVALSKSDPQLIIQAMRAGAGEFLEAPVSASDLREAFMRHLGRRRKSQESQTTGTLYSVIAGKLSSGATTVSINVAAAIAAASETSSLLIDLDMPLGDAAAYLNLRPQYSVHDALAAAMRLDPMLLGNFAVAIKNTGMNVLGGFRDYTPRTAVPAPALDALFRVSRQTFRHTVVDLSGSLDGDQAVVVARHSHQVLVVLTPDLPAIWRTEKLLTFLSQHGAADNVKLVLNRTSRRDDISERDITRLLSHPVYCTLPNDYGACLRAINAGRPLHAEDSRALYQSIQQLALQMAGIPNRKDSRSLLGLFLRPSSPTIGG